MENYYENPDEFFLLYQEAKKYVLALNNNPK